MSAVEIFIFITFPSIFVPICCILPVTVIELPVDLNNGIVQIILAVITGMLIGFFIIDQVGSALFIYIHDRSWMLYLDFHIQRAVARIIYNNTRCL